MKTHPLFPALLLLANATYAEPVSISLDAPLGGWRVGNRDKASYLQNVHYPPSFVNSNADQSDTARIRGVISTTPKSAEAKGNPSPQGNEEQKAILIVNGIGMPLRVGEDGRFDRPYTFPTGENSVEVRAADGRTARTQFYDTGGGATPPRLRIVMSWDSNNTDLDLHVVTPNGEHAWYGGRVLKDGSALDVDVTTGYGPEIFSSPAPQSGPYLVYVNYYGGGYRWRTEVDNPDSDSDSGSEAYEPKAALTTLTLSVVFEEGTVNERVQTFFAPMRAPGELTLISRFIYP
ncbi:Hypothetical protein HDN1F_23780 [gamma proteobacterium HdN1]|nr:Hypothetical protein HDN1F_23780 [gamma proteobacterium HdN1]